ncbi:pyridoxal-phosphate dependent enzyme [Dyella sp. M7H15-1]|uniref:pyridoxal-phosphate dependent enzyme n=1 Tax=Dyella sp. M7H15-1 TaxID=2501295 RepID=UPI001005053F|nr:pyridoxal-phosphate dependent enzyme [Dyella sp. M7H15-1]QAU24153.1 pyridoxal-phosphate dependent enzyme [Dyella sp. M7H15-1]
MSVSLPSLDQIHDAAARIAPHAILTPVLRHSALDEMLGAQLYFKCENLQCGGAFKFRGACNAVWSLTEEQAVRGVVTHSSGNHGNALAMAAATRGIAAHVVVPDGAVRAKLEAIEKAGAILHRCAPMIAAREAKAAQVQQTTGATLVHPYADTHVIAGQGTLVLELLQQSRGLDTIITPVGGGGLSAGCSIAAHGIDPAIAMFGAEPSGADDAAQSLARGARIDSFTPNTLCDGLRTLIGEPNFHALREHQVEIITVSDEESIQAMRLLWQTLKLVVEISSATVLAAVLKQRQRFAGRRIGLVLTGGNVDIDVLPW